jgi:threonine dehydrogenase-like Zn-dependent dehydrogenase
VKKWIPQILPLLEGEGDPLGVDYLTTHRMPLAEAPRGYEIFREKEDGAIKVVLQP